MKKIATDLEIEDTRNGVAVFEAINKKDSRICPIFENYCLHIAYLVYNVQAVIDMERVVIGGGIIAQPIVLEEIKRQYNKILNQLEFIKPMITPVDIQLCAMGNDANLLGALYQLLVSEGNKYYKTGEKQSIPIGYITCPSFNAIWNLEHYYL
ncbi:MULTISPECIES: ROK family protein [unclassified Facklamia]|uniref:ROK family protein n=1 Tax=Aerococcaceae TaxID=186827 RepID=UPI002106C838|nr:MULTISPECIES: ROK family protein [unclassified Facklamia]